MQTVRFEYGLAGFCAGAILFNVPTGVLLGAAVTIIKDFAKSFFEKNKDFFIMTFNLGLVAFCLGTFFSGVPTGIFWGASAILIKDCLIDDKPPVHNPDSNRVLTAAESNLKYWNHLGEEGTILENTADKNGNVLVNFKSRSGNDHHSNRVSVREIIGQNYATGRLHPAAR